jgi:hypothetical protein
MPGIALHADKIVLLEICKINFIHLSAMLFGELLPAIYRNDVA